MTQEDFRKLVLQRWNTEWSALYPTAKWQTDNETFVPIAGIPWHRIEVRHQSSEQVTLGPVGTRRCDNTALIIIRHYVPINTGVLLADQYCDKTKAFLSGISFATIVANGAGQSAEGTSDGLWWRIQQSFSVQYPSIF